MPGPDPDDHVHSAAAIGGHANILLTRDAKGFPQTALRKRGLRVTTVDQFLCEQFALFPDDLIRVLGQPGGGPHQVATDQKRLAQPARKTGHLGEQAHAAAITLGVLRRECHDGGG
jgi:hypothetical protein